MRQASVNPLVTLLGYVLFVPLLALLLPLGYGMFLMLAFVLPPVCACVIVSDAIQDQAPFDPGDVAGKLLIAVVLLPLGLLAFAAPLRALLELATSFYMPAWIKVEELHAGLYGLFTPLFGDLSRYWIDFYWGLIGVAIIFVIAALDSIRRNMLVRQIRVMPTSRVRSVAVGLAELKGKAVPVRKSARSEPIIRQWVQSSDSGASTQTHIEPFYLDDGTGRILVDARGCKVNPDNSAFSVELHQAVLTKFEPRTGLPESRLMPGDTVYVLGNVRVQKAARGAHQTDATLVVEPKRSSPLSLSFYDLFFVSNLGEEALLSTFRRSVERGWSKVLVAMALCAWLSVWAWTDITQIEALDVGAAPRLYRLAVPATTLEREIIVGRERAPAIHWLDQLRRGGDADGHEIMKQLRHHHAALVAVPILLAQAADIDHPGFGLANLWLAKLDRRPDGLWGAQLLDEKYAEANETVVPKLLARSDNGKLFVSYRAHFSKQAPETRRRKIVARTVAIELVELTDQVEYAVEIDAHEGWNRVDEEVAFFNLLPGVYSLKIFPKAHYGGGLYFSGSRQSPELTIELRDLPV